MWWRTGAGFGSLAILMPVLLVMDVLGIAAFRKVCDRALLRFILPFGE